jgi:cellulose synthase/poly-beta-1,6-N-acetylglucosamine synthase-like glycosyltransferase
MNIPAPLVLAPSGWLDFTLSALMLAPLLFFAGCAIYLWRLLCYAIPGRSRVLDLEYGGAALSTRESGAASHSANGAPPACIDQGAPARFAVIIPAHNEELVIASALESVSRLDYPREAYRVIVIADNCTDNTATIARQCGADVLERHDTTAIGKGFALAWALETLIEESPRKPETASPARSLGEGTHRGIRFDAVVILDADTKPASNLLSIFAERLNEGSLAIQARYEVLNAEESWRTRLMTCALALVHIAKPLGRERLALSDGLKGNGMCFARSIVEAVQWSGDSITEDIDYTLRLCLAGHRVEFAPETAVWAQMPVTGKQAASQRRRWEQGRYALLFRVAPGLLREAVRRRSAILFDRAAELIVPPFAEMVAVPFVLMVICFIAGQGLHLRLIGAYGWAWGIVLLMFAGYLGAGLWVARTPFKVAITTLYAPAYIIWKFGLYGLALLTRSGEGWKRTERRNLDG